MLARNENPDALIVSATLFLSNGASVSLSINTPACGAAGDTAVHSLIHAMMVLIVCGSTVGPAFTFGHGFIECFPGRPQLAGAAGHDIGDAHLAAFGLDLDTIALDLQMARRVQQHRPAADHFDAHAAAFVQQVNVAVPALHGYALAGGINNALQNHMIAGMDADHVFGRCSLAFGRQGDFVAARRAPTLGVSCAVRRTDADLPDAAENDGIVVPGGVELHQDALADFGQGQKAAVGVGAGRMTAGQKALCARSLSAAIRGQGVQPDALTRRLGVERLELKLDLDASLLVGVVIVVGDIGPDSAGGPGGRRSVGWQQEASGLQVEGLAGGCFLGMAGDGNGVDEVLLAFDIHHVAGRERQNRAADVHLIKGSLPDNGGDACLIELLPRRERPQKCPLRTHQE